MHPFFWQSKPWQAFINFAIIFSFIMNIILLIVVLLVAPLVLPIVSDIAVPIVGGLSDSFKSMNEAKIEQTININEPLPIQLNIPIQEQTSVVLSAPVRIEGASANFVLPGGGGTINGDVTITLPEGTELPVNLDFAVEVNDDIPVALDVPVTIPLAETDLGEPFGKLQALFTPLDQFLRGLPQDQQELQTRINVSLQDETANSEEEQLAITGE